MLQKELEHFITEDLGEDIYPDIVGSTPSKATITSNQPGIISGVSEASQVFNYFNTTINFKIEDGTQVTKGTKILEATGNAEELLKAERLALNFISRMSGIATLTHNCKQITGNIIIAATRKTTPGFRKFEKKAVIHGGGDPHRYNLSGAVMIKDNHIEMLGIEQAIQNAKKTAGYTRKIEIEVENPDDAIHAAKLGVDIIMLDNLTPPEIRETIEKLTKEHLREKIILEASGNITPQNIKKYAKTGVDIISLGSLTHSAKWLDISMSIKKTQGIS